MTDLFEVEAPATTTSLELRRLQRQQRRRERRLRTLVASSVALVIFALGASFAFNFVQSLKPVTTSVDDYTGSGQGQVQVVINSGDDGRTIAATLFASGVVASEGAFFLEWNANQEAAMRIQPGYYVLQREMKAQYALEALLDTDRKVETAITIPEGYNLTKTLEQVASVTGYSIGEVEAIAEDTEAIGLPPEANGSLEGWLFPATYRFNPGVKPADVLAEMISTTTRVLEDHDVPRENWLTTLTFASLVEKEAGLDVDRPLIAGVIQNRLDIGMALELDSTIHYFAPTGNVFSDAGDRESSNPYNTYKFPGLPPGPIANPGELSIEAALAPADVPYLFFVTVDLGTKETRYATTYAEHLRNVDLLRAWMAANGEE